MTPSRIALLGGFALSASACANIWNFEDLQVAADASKTVRVTQDASVDATRDSRVNSPKDAGPLADADATLDEPDSIPGDAMDVGDAGDANDATSVVCQPGFHNCAGTCSSDLSLDSCGPSSCSPCIIPVGGLQLMCNGTACVSSCPPMLTLCEGGGPSGECVDLRSHPSHCGACATVCPAPDAGGIATCSGTPRACGVSFCDAGLTACPVAKPTACVDLTSSASNCGACSNACPPRDGAASCVNGGCQ